MKRKIIHTIAKYSNWNSADIETTFFEEGIYPDKKDWQQMISLLLLATGVVFLSVGIVFFFAFNWASLHKFLKLGLIESMILCLTLLVGFGKLKPSVKEILLIGDVILIGVLFAVFGQIYQTGANAYDFFFGWVLAAVLWVIAGNTLPLWTIFLVLVNITVILYFQQVRSDVDINTVLELLFVVNGLVLLVRSVAVETDLISNEGRWFHYLLTLFIIGCLTFSILDEIFEDKAPVGIIFMLISFSIWYFYAMKKKDVFYLGVLGASIIIIIISSIVYEIHFDSFEMFLFISILVIVLVGLLVRYLVKLNQKWYGTA